MLIAVDAYLERERNAYLRAGIVAAAILNVHRPRGKPPIQPHEFVPPRRRPRRRAQTPAQMAELLKAATIMMGGAIRHMGGASRHGD